MKITYKGFEIDIRREQALGGWSSEVEFEEVPNKKFNTVMFEDVI